jgi:polyhydroxyalkanoate synthase subunit PhaC
MADAPKSPTPQSPLPNVPPQIDPEVLQKSLTDIAERSARVVSEFIEKQPHAEVAQSLEDLGVNRAFMELGTKLMANPGKLAEMQVRAWDDYLKLWSAMVMKAAGGQPTPVREPSRGDNRFKSELWQNNFVFDYIKQSYLIAADHVQRTVAEAQGLDDQTARKVNFFTRQFVDALAPTNFVLTNPEVLKATQESGGQNLLKGLEHLLKDLDRGHGKLAISMTDYEAFELGVNVATTPGRVVYQNDLMQLIQYEPATPQVDRTPLLIVPPWINKYYILDLRARNSFVKWAVDHGLTVFVISWVNPDKRHADKTFDDYLREGPVAAMDAIERATGEASVNLIGYCLGGTLTACLMSWLETAGRPDRVKSVTYFTTMIDFTEPGELGVFVDETSVANLEKRMAARGFLEGSDMAGTFNMLRDNDLIWSFVVNNYLLGKDPFPFDLLFWNSDSTRMPPKMHAFYLRNMYLKNLLTKPGALEVCGAPVDLGQVDTPTYFISTMEDHIAPWKSTYAGARLFAGPVRFVLGGSGHIAGIVNPPVAQKYCYWTNPQLDADPEKWLAGAERREGSWWDDWGAWVSGFGDGKVAARVPGSGGLKVIEDAPGSYAKLRLDAQAKAGTKAKSSAGTAAPAPAAPEATATPAVAKAPVATPAAAAPAAPRKAPAAKPKAAAKAANPKATAKAAKPSPGEKPTAAKKVAAPARKAAPAAGRTGKTAPVRSAPPAAAPAQIAPVSIEKPKATKPAKVAAPKPSKVEPSKKPAKTAVPAEKKKTARPAPGTPAELISALFKAQTPDTRRTPAPEAPAGGKRKRSK